jgi:hypothetical protein
MIHKGIRESDDFAVDEMQPNLPAVTSAYDKNNGQRVPLDRNESSVLIFHNAVRYFAARTGHGFRSSEEA